MTTFRIAELVRDFAAGMVAVDAKRPQAKSARSQALYQPGLGPHTEAQTVAMVMEELAGNGGLRYAGAYRREVRYPAFPRSKCDLCLGPADESGLAVEIKMLRLMGDNGKPNDNILMHLLSPYPAHRSAVTDCEKLLGSRLPGRKGILIFGYEYEDWPMELAIRAFEVLASQRVELGTRFEGEGAGLVHPVHRHGRVFGWELVRALGKGD